MHMENSPLISLLDRVTSHAPDGAPFAAEPHRLVAFNDVVRELYRVSDATDLPVNAGVDKLRMLPAYSTKSDPGTTYLLQDDVATVLVDLVVDSAFYKLVGSQSALERRAS